MSLKWWRGFSKRHPNLSTRKTTALDIRRVRATQPEIFDHFFKLVKHEYDTNQYTRDQVWALDETGVAGDMKTNKAVGPKGTNSNIQTLWKNNFEFKCVTSLSNHVLCVSSM